MTLFLDSADLGEIADALVRRAAAGITTNPIHLAAAVDGRPLDHLREIVQLVRGLGTVPLSVQVMATDAEGLVAAAERAAEQLDYENLAIKIACGWEGLAAVSTLVDRGYTVNCTACMTFSQALLAAEAGAQYVSMFYGKASDAGVDFIGHARLAAARFDRLEHRPRLIVGSIRRPHDIHEMLAIGVHIVTVQYPFLRQLAGHSKTDEAIAQFWAGYAPILEER